MSVIPSVLPRLRRVPALVILVACAGLLLAVGLITDRPAVWPGLLTAAIYGIGIALGAALLTAIHAVTGARWWHGLEGVHRSVSRLLIPGVVALGLTLVFGLSDLYPWARPEVMHHDPVIAAKAAWLSAPLFLARAVVICLCWFGIIARLNRRVADGAPLGGAGALFLIVFALTIGVAHWDWTMSLEPAWYSTMHGVYAFAGVFQGGIAAVTLLALHLERRGTLRLTDGQAHDLGKFLFAFSFFWAYIWFCQFMLIWYANLPEEAAWYVHRESQGWSMLSWVNPLLCFAVPFVGLMTARAKKHRPTLAQIALVVLAGRWLDTWLTIAPSVGPPPAFPIWAAAAAVVVVGGMILLVLRRQQG